MDIGLHLQNILNCYLCTLKATGVNSFKIIGVVQACFTTDLQLIVNCVVLCCVEPFTIREAFFVTLIFLQKHGLKWLNNAL